MCVRHSRYTEKGRGAGSWRNWLQPRHRCSPPEASRCPRGGPDPAAKAVRRKPGAPRAPLVWGKPLLWAPPPRSAPTGDR